MYLYMFVLYGLCLYNYVANIMGGMIGLHTLIPGHYSSVIHLLINHKCFGLSGKIPNLGLAVSASLSLA